jgi:protein-tyrosine phosphatase
MPLSDPFRILFVCTGNVCRSPFAEVLTRGLCAAQDFPVEVGSAGLDAPVGAPMHPDTRAALARWDLAGAPAEGCRARLLTPAMVVEADLVLGATLEHRAAIVRLAPKGLRHTFALREFARLAAAVDPAGLPTDPAARGRAVVVAAKAHRGARPVAPDADDIADPIGRPAAAHLAAAAAVADAVSTIVRVLTGVTTPEMRTAQRV